MKQHFFTYALDSNNLGINCNVRSPRAGIKSTKVGRAFIFAAILLFVSSASYSQITVSGSNGKDGNYATLTTTTTGAFAAINSANESGRNITITITANVTTEPGTVLLTGLTAAWTSLTIQPSGARTISGTVAGPLITLSNSLCTNVTIDGLNSGGNSLTIANLSTSASASTIKLDRAPNNTIQNCVIQGSALSAANNGMLFLTTSGTTGCTNTVIQNNVFNSSSGGVPYIPIFSVGSSTTVYNSGTIQNNDIKNYFNPTGSSFGIYISSNNGPWTITGNNFFQTATRTTTSGTGVHRGIYISNTWTGSGSSTISNNIFGYANNTQTGTTTYNGSGTYAISYLAIDVDNLGASHTMNIDNNTIAGISFSSTAGGTVFTGINVSVTTATTVNVGATTGNTIGTSSASIVVTSTGSIPIINGINYNSVSNGAISNNIVQNISTTGSIGYTFNGILTGSSATLTISNNNIGNNLSNSIVIGTSGSTNANLLAYGIQCVSTGAPRITGNEINTIYTYAGTGTSKVAGILSSATTTNVISNNNINLLTSTSSSSTTGAYVYGIYKTATAAAVVDTISNNTIANITSSAPNPATGTPFAMGGIVINASNANSIGRVFQNVIHDISNTYSSTSATIITGIYFDGGGVVADSGLVSRNLIYSISANNANTSAILTGIKFANSTLFATASNNIIQMGLAGGSSITGAMTIYGINESSGSNTVRYFHNTVYIGGTGVSTTPTGKNTYCYFETTLNSTSSRYKVNNIFVNARSSSSAAGGKHYAIGIGGSSISGSTNNDNDYYVSGTQGVLGTFNGADKTTLSAWQSAPGQDANSKSVDPLFANPNGATPSFNFTNSVTSSQCDAQAGIANAGGVTIDFYGNTRSSFTPVDWGAVAWASVSNPASFSATAASQTQINLTASANGSGDNIVVVTNGTGTFSTPTNGAVPTVGASYAGGTVLYIGTAAGLTNHTGLTISTTYYYKSFSFTPGYNYSSGLAANATTQGAGSISTADVSPSTYCAGDSILVNFTPDGTINGGNIYTAVLSNSSGSFASGTSDLGTLASTGSGSQLTIHGIIPAGASTSSAYLVRVNASNPSITGSSNSAFTINALPTVAAITGGNSNVCPGANTAAFNNATGGGTWSMTNTTLATINTSNRIVTGWQAGLDTVVYTVSSGGCTNRAIASLTVDGPSISTQPVSPAPTCSGTGTQVISVVAGGSGLTYSWTKGGSPVSNDAVISGQGTATLTLTQPTSANAGVYGVTLTGTCGTLTSNNVTVTVNGVKPNVTVPSPVCTSSSAFQLTASAAAAPGGGYLDTIGNGTSISGNSFWFSRNRASSAHNQLLYLGSEFASLGANTTGFINKIAFYVAEKNSTGAYPAFTVSVAQTNATEVLAVDVTSTFTTVYSGNYSTILGWNEIAFSSPYPWDGTSNLIFDLCYVSTSSNAPVNSADNFYCTVIGGSILRSANANGNGTTAGCGTTAYVASTQHANMQYNLSTLTYSWSPSTYLSDATALQPVFTPPGTGGVYTYTLTVTDNSGCTSTAYDTVTVVGTPTISLGSNPSVCQGTTSANLTYSAITGSPDKYSLSWSDAATTAGFSNVTNATLTSSPIVLTVPSGGAVGTYKALLAVTNSTMSCGSSADSISVTILAVPAISATDGTQSVCQNATPTNLTVTAAGAGLTYQWYNNGSTNSTSGGSPATGAGNTSASYTPDVSTPGTTYYYCIVSGTCSPPATSAAAVGVTVVAPPTVAAITGGSSPVCPGANTAVYNNATPGGVWSMTNENATINPANRIVTGWQAGVDTVVYTVTSDGCSTSVISIVTIDIPSIAVQPVAPAPVCSGTGTQVMTVTATGAGVSYSWKKGGVAVSDDAVISGQGTATLTLTQPASAYAGVYSVVLNGTCGLLPSNNVTVTVNDIQSSVTVPSPVCAGSSAFQLSASTSSVPGGGAADSIGNGTSTSGNSFWFSRNRASSAHNQLLYLASQFPSPGANTARYLNTISFYVFEKNSTGPFTNFTVSVAQTAATKVLSVDNTSTFTTVYSGNYSTVLGWNDITFSSPYPWDGTSNLLFDLCFANTSSNAPVNSADNFYCTIGDTLRSAFTNGSNTSAGCGTTTYVASTQQANMKFKLSTLTYSWSPSDYLSDASALQPVFTPPGTGGTYTYTLTVSDNNGCSAVAYDTVTVTALTATPAVPSPICDGATAISGTSEADASITIYNNSSEIGTATADGSGNWSATVSAVAGGDAITATALSSGLCLSEASSGVTVSNSTSGSESTTGCDSYVWNGVTYTSGGDKTYLFTGGNAAGCDSTATLHLTINSSSSGEESATACDSYIWNGSTYTSGGDKTHLFAGGNAVGCDSTSTLHLSINSSSSSEESATACNSYVWNGSTYTSGGDKTHLFAGGNAVGCDSTATLHLTINSSSSGEESATACDSYVWNETSYTGSGDKTYLFAGGNAVGCDSTATLHLTIKSSSSGEESATACDSYVWNGATYTSGGDKTHLFAGGNAAGCDSTATLHLTINLSSSGDESQTACDSYVWNGSTYTSGGDKTHLFAGGNAVGCDSTATLHLTINNSSAGEVSATACDSYVWNGATYTSGGDKTHLLTGGNAAGCDSTATLHLTINSSSSGSESATVCDSYVWNGSTYTSGGDKTHLFAGGNVVGCDSTATLHLTINSSSSGEESATACDSYVWNETTYTGSGDKTYLFAGGNAVGCDSTATLHLTINSSSSGEESATACDSYVWNETTYTGSGDKTYLFAGGNAVGCDSAATLHLTINSSSSGSESQTACDIYIWNGSTYTSGGDKTHLFAGGNAVGCDSTATLHLTINSSSSGSESQTACDSYIWNGSTYTSGGDKTHLFAGGNAVGCDSTATLHLTINGSSSGEESATACDSYVWNGATYTSAGDKTHLFAGGNAVGCDSTATLHLTINSSSSGEESATACDSYVWNGATYTSGGDKTHLFAGGNAAGCDSTATLHLTINSSSSGSESQTACDSYIWNGATYTSGGDKTHLFAGGNAAGCDSTATLHLTINLSSSGEESATACNSYVWNGATYTSGGDKTHLFAGGNTAGCDSTSTLHLTINSSSSGEESATACDSYVWNGATYTSGGDKTYLFSGGNAAGCDSTATLHLTINLSSSGEESATACNSYVWNGATYTSAGDKTHLFAGGNTAGCDSTSTLHLTINSSSSGSESATACDGYIWNGSTYTSGGDKTHLFAGGNAAGCDSTATLHLTINLSSSGEESATACNSYVWNGATYTSAGDKTHLFAGGNTAGCDSTSTLHLTINSSSSGSESATACDSYIWNGSTYTSGGDKTHLFAGGNAAGCDSTATLHLTINSSSSGEESATACNSYVWNGSTYTSGGDKTHLFAGGNTAGCDSTATLHLTINSSSSGSESQTACDSYVWNGSTYTSGGDKTHLFAGGNTAGCDSTATLHLTINSSSSGSESQTACDSYVWNGSTYTSGGDKTHLFAGGNTAGCDSTATLHLTINSSSSGEESVTACNSYVWNGVTYTSGGDNTHLFAGGNAVGCDSTATLHLTINSSISGEVSATACDSYVWNGSTYTTGGDKTYDAGTNAAGCDSVATLHLTINLSSSGSESQTACDSYEWNGSTYTSGGDNTYLFTGGNAAGCDSTATLHLTLNSSSSGSESQTACDSYVWNGSTYTTGGDKTHLFAGGNAAGCDSTATLHLTLKSSSSGEESATACDSYVWNGATYTSGGDKTHLFAGGNAVGCDSTATLHLTINSSSSGSSSSTACDSYVWNGSTYTTGGDKTHLFAGGNAAGCDSTATLHLTIKSSSSSSQSATACVSYIWNGTTYTTSGDKTRLFAGGNAAGCDSTATLHLTIFNSSIGSSSATACDSYIWNGSTYTTSGDKTHLFAGGGASGCDSIALVHLTIRNSSAGEETQTACGSYIWNGATYTTGGDKIRVFTGGNAAGCDSTVTLHLTITPNPTTSDAGPDQTLCNTTTATLAGNTPAIGTGAWTVVSGSGTVTYPDSATSGVTGLTFGDNVFRWTISNGTCTSSSLITIHESCLTLNLKLLIQDYYLGAGKMSPLLSLLGISSRTTDVDTVTIELRSKADLNNAAYSYSGILKSDGAFTSYFPTATPGHYYYLVLKHRNSVETWSADSVQVNDGTFYDFTTSQTKAYQNNMTDFGDGKYGIYSGDVNHDGAVDASDKSSIQGALSSFIIGTYDMNDINGDGSVDIDDFRGIQNNVPLNITIKRP